MIIKDDYLYHSLNFITPNTHTRSYLHRHGSWGHLSPKIHPHHALHVGLHNRYHGEALLLLLLLLLHWYHACINTHTNTHTFNLYLVLT